MFKGEKGAYGMGLKSLEESLNLLKWICLIVMEILKSKECFFHWREDLATKISWGFSSKSLLHFFPLNLTLK